LGLLFRYEGYSRLFSSNDLGVYIHNKEMAVVRQINRDQITDSKPLSLAPAVIREQFFIGTKRRNDYNFSCFGFNF
jgi:hypothetical protein